MMTVASVSRRTQLGSALAVLFVSAAVAAGTETYWQHDPATPGEWFDPANWTAGVPATMDKAYIDNAGTVTVAAGDGEAYNLFVGDYSGGTLVHTGGSLTVGMLLEVAVQQGSSGTYTLSGAGSVCSPLNLRVGVGGTGHFIQSGGVCNAWDPLYLGYHYNSQGTYELMDGELSAGGAFVGRLGTGLFVQSGGTAILNGHLTVGYSSSFQSTYLLHSGQLSAAGATIGDEGVGRFAQTGGTHTLTEPLHLGIYFGEGTYELVGPGEMSAPAEHVGKQGQGIGVFVQSAGVNTTGRLSIDDGGRYELTGGILNVTDYVSLVGELDFRGSATLNLGDWSYADLTGGTFLTVGEGTITGGANSIVLFPAGFDPATQLADYTTSGVTHIAGNALVLPAGSAIIGQGSFEDHVQCQGAITVHEGGSFNLNAGLEISSSGSVDLGAGGLIVDDLVSGLDGGQLSAQTEYVGNAGQGRFVHSSGSNIVGDALWVGYVQGTEGTYELGGGELTAEALEVGGYYGTGTFIQTGGVVTTHGLTMGRGAGSIGTYEMSGGELFSDYANIGTGYEGSWLFRQTGGRHVTGDLYVRDSTYEVSGTAELSVGSAYLSGPMVSIRQSGGVVNITGELAVQYHLNSECGYELTGGLLTAGEEIIGQDLTRYTTFVQGGGINRVGFLEIRDGSTYELSGGTLEVTEGVLLNGPIDFADASATLNVNCVAAFTEGTLTRSGSASLHLGPNSLALLSPGFDLGSLFGSFTSEGIVHHVGSPLNIPAGTTVIGRGTIEDRVECAGALIAPAGSALNLLGGVGLAGGTVDLGSGDLIVEGPTTSELAGGELATGHQYVGYEGTGWFTHISGSNRLAGRVPAYLNALQLGVNANAEGTYELRAGELAAPREYVGVSGTGWFVQTGGTNDVESVLSVGSSEGSSGTYELSGDGQLNVHEEYIGNRGTGVFIQTGGVHTITSADEELCIGNLSTSSGRYELHGGELRVTPHVEVADYGTASFVQTGGTHVVAGSMAIARRAGSIGSYTLSGGQLQAHVETVGMNGSALFTHTGGTNTVTEMLYLSYHDEGDSTYSLSGTGELTAAKIQLARLGSATFFQTAGRCTVGTLEVCDGGLYELRGGELAGLRNEYIRGTFAQTGGTHMVGTPVVNGVLNIGSSYGGPATYEISGGVLDADYLYVGDGGYGSVNITDAAAEISISTWAIFGSGTFLFAVPGATIHMTGAGLENRSINPVAMAGLGNLTLIFEGGPATFDYFEVAGADVGTDPTGWTDNFALGTLQLGGADSGSIRLMDGYSNRGPGTEALYVDWLVLNPGAKIEFNDLNLYFLNGGAPKQLFHGDATLDGCVDGLDYVAWSNHYLMTGMGWCDGDLTGDQAVDGLDYVVWSNNYLQGCPASPGAVPEPSSAVLLVAGLWGLSRRRKERLAD